jgi:hypothetical protein
MTQTTQREDRNTDDERVQESARRFMARHGIQPRSPWHVLSDVQWLEDELAGLHLHLHRCGSRAHRRYLRRLWMACKRRAPTPQPPPPPNADFAALLDASAQAGWPFAGLTDLYIRDDTYIRTEQPPVFGWMLRELGTNLFDPRHGGLAQAHLALAQDCPARLYWWDGTSLRLVTDLQLRRLLAAHQPPYDPRGRFLVVQDAPSTYSVVDSATWTPVQGSLGTGALAEACALWHNRHAPTVRGLLAAPH